MEGSSFPHVRIRLLVERGEGSVRGVFFVVQLAFVLAGRGPRHFFEDFCKIALVVKAHQSGDLQQAPVRVAHEFRAVLNADAVEVVGKAGAQLLPEQLGQRGLVEEQGGGQIPQSQLVHIVGVDVGHGPGGR